MSLHLQAATADLCAEITMLKSAHQGSAMEQLVSPLKDQVISLGSAVREIELKRESTFTRLNQQFVNLVGAHQQLQSTNVVLLGCIKCHR